MSAWIETLRGGLVVSCQAAPGSPLDSPEILAAMARCAELSGAVGIRANYARNIRAIAQAVRLPIIGIKKREVPGYEVYITPEYKDALEAAQAGAQIIALDATPRPRPGSDNFAALTRRIHSELDRRVMADISTYEEGIAAAEAGADIIATTLSGYTTETATSKARGPDLELVARLSDALKPLPVICEGRIHTPQQARDALEAGAFAVVVGTAITATDWIAAQFARALSR
jgi:N-acylglucosamine-6-phosphate 2-epimerase